MALAFTHQGRLVIVLDEENVGRMQQADPFDFDMKKMGLVGVLKMPLEITVAYATKAELPLIARMVDGDQVMAYLQRGYVETATDRQRGTAYQPLPHTPVREQ